MAGVKKGDRVGDAAHPGTVISVYSNGEAKVRSDDGRVWTTEARFLRKLDANAAPTPLPAWAPPVTGAPVTVNGQAFATQSQPVFMQPQPAAQMPTAMASAVPAPVAMASAMPVVDGTHSTAAGIPVVAQGQPLPTV